MRAGLDSDGDRAWDYDLQVEAYYTQLHSALERIMNIHEFHELREIFLTVCNSQRRELLNARGQDRSKAKLQLIPVVTSLAPLASNSEGLKDR